MLIVANEDFYRNGELVIKKGSVRNISLTLDGKFYTTTDDGRFYGISTLDGWHLVPDESETFHEGWTNSILLPRTAQP